MVPGLHPPGRRQRLPPGGQESGRYPAPERVHQRGRAGQSGHPPHLARRAEQLPQDLLRKGSHLPRYTCANPAPEELKDIQFGKIEPSKDERLAESFSVGLTCLDAGTLNNSSQLFQKNKFAYEQLEARLGDLQASGYSELLNIVIRNLCEVDPDRRCSCSELFRWLKPYEESIINLERFEVPNLP